MIKNGGGGKKALAPARSVLGGSGSLGWNEMPAGSQNNISAESVTAEKTAFVLILPLKLNLTMKRGGRAHPE